MRFPLISHSLFALIPPVFAQTTGEGKRIRVGLDRAKDVAGLPGGYTITFLSGALKIVLGLVGVVFFVMVLYAGFTWMTSMGNSERVESAQKTLLWATIGLVVTLGAYVIVHYILTQLVNLVY